MITAISRFRVKNGMRDAVAEAFRNRPHLVDYAPGFIGMEVYSEVSCPDIFLLYTHWADIESFRSWHSSPAHHDSHQWIPKGLQLDAAYTEVRVLQDTESPDGPETLLHKALDQSKLTFWIDVDYSGGITDCASGFARARGVSRSQLKGLMFADLVVESDKSTVRTFLKERCDKSSIVVNIDVPGALPFSVQMRLFVHGSGIVILLERIVSEEHMLQQELIVLNNEYARVTRDLQQRTRELTQTRDALKKAITEKEKSFWYIKKVHEVLPICVNCGKVKMAETDWREAREFLQNNSDFLSHGYCPECLGRWRETNKL